MAPPPWIIMAIKQSLGKEERLKSGPGIQELLKNGQTVSGFPLKIFWSAATADQKFPACMAVSVPKKKFRRAVDRNLMKRRIREAYRIHKYIIYGPLKKSGVNMSLLILFLSDEFISFADLEVVLKKLLESIAKKLS